MGLLMDFRKGDREWGVDGMGKSRCSVGIVIFWDV